jgi:hypothetical protein
MTFTRSLAAWCIIPSAACLIFAGCAQKASTASTQKDDSQLAADTTSRVKEIQSRVSELDALSQQLPGANDQSNRKLVAEAFAGLTRILPLIEGDYQSGEFRQGMRVLNSSREQLASGSPDLAAEPTVGQGLRAAERLLRNLNSFVFDNNADLTKSLDMLQKKVVELDTAHGPMNRVLAAQAFRTTTDILQQMSTALVERAGLEGAPTTNPAKKPDVAGTALR